MFLPPSNEKAQSKLLFARLTSSVPNQVLLVRQQSLKWGLGLGGILSLCCTPALSNPVPGTLAGANAGFFQPASNLNAGTAADRAVVPEDSSYSFNSLLVPCDSQSCSLLSGLAPAQIVAAHRVDTLYDETAADKTVTVASGIPSSEGKGGAAFDTQAQTPSTAMSAIGTITASPDTKAVKDLIEAQAVNSEIPDFLSNAIAESDTDQGSGEKLDDDLGIIRVRQLRSRANEELGILRLLQTAQASPPPPPPKRTTAFLTGRLGLFDSENAFRSDPKLDETIYQSGLSLYLFPRLSNNTNLYAIAETNLARYENFESVNYNEIEFQFGVRQRLLPRTYAQIGWRNQRLYSPGFRDKLFSVNAIDTLVSHRSILSSKLWLDSFYQARLGFADPNSASRFRQTLTLSLNYGITRSLRTNLLYQIDFDDYTQVARFDTYQQVLGIISYNVTPESRLSLFGGTRFGRSSSPGVSLEDTFYGAGLNISVPLF